MTTIQERIKKFKEEIAKLQAIDEGTKIVPDSLILTKKANKIFGDKTNRESLCISNQAYIEGLKEGMELTAKEIFDELHNMAVLDMLTEDNLNRLIEKYGVKT